MLEKNRILGSSHHHLLPGPQGQFQGGNTPKSFIADSNTPGAIFKRVTRLKIAPGVLLTRREEKNPTLPVWLTLPQILSLLQRRKFTDCRNAVLGNIVSGVRGVRRVCKYSLRMMCPEDLK